jgi:tyrosine-protein phosphatase SIW14
MEAATMSRTFHIVFVSLLTLLIFGAPVGYAYVRQNQFRHLKVVKNNVLYRSGQLNLRGLKQTIHDLGIKTVITLRPGDIGPDQDEEAYCRSQEINYLRIAPQRWWANGGSVPAEEGVKTFIKVMDDPANFPVLVHCMRGVHRTGAFCAVYRMEYQGWSNAKAIEELRDCGYKELEDEFDILTFLEQYKPRHAAAGANRGAGCSEASATRP